MESSNGKMAFKLMVQKAWSVFPIKSGDKIPLIREVVPYRSRLPSEEEIIDWWTQWPNANIGLITGKLSNVSVLDVDREDHDDLTSPLAEHGDLPSTLISKTGSGGKHYIYAYSPFADGIKDLRPNINVKSEGGYIVLPPSLHKSGNRYEWLNKESITKFPDHLVQRGATMKSPSPMGLMMGVGTGSRNNTAASLAGLCVKNKFAPDQTLLFLKAWNEQNEPPLDERELRIIVESIYKTDSRNHPKVDDGWVQVLEAARITREQLQGKFYPTGFKNIDEALKGGIRSGDLGIVSGYAGHGKSLLAMQVSYQIAVDQVASGWFEYEMLEDEMGERWEALSVTKDHKIYTPKKTHRTDIEWLEEKILEAKRLGMSLFFIDLLDYIRPKTEGQRVSMNKADYIQKVVEQLKAIAQQQQVAIVLMAHLRKPERGAGKEPSMFDLKDSSAIYNLANWVLIIHRLTKKHEDELLGSKVADPNDPSTMLTENQEGMYAKVYLEKNRRTGKKAAVLLKHQESKFNEVEISEEKLKRIHF